jgi:hypothetical protein
MTSVPQLWPGGTIVILASGPSLTQQDADYVRGKADAVIAINTTYQLAPWADCLYGSDGSRRFWRWHNGVPTFTGLKYTVEANKYGVPALRNTGQDGLETHPTGLRTGKNSAYAAINLAFHFGAQKIVLLGVDMGRGPTNRAHWHGEHPDKSVPPFDHCLRLFPTIVEPLQNRQIDVVNCSRQTAVTCFPRVPLEEAL